MSFLIGKVLPDGTVRHITLNEPPVYFKQNKSILLRFYSREHRLDALIDLGNLSELGPSPYGRWVDYYDKVHCRAEIRDHCEAKKKRLPRISEDKEAFRAAGKQGFLWEGGEWYYMEAGITAPLKTYAPEVACEDERLSKGIEIRAVNGNGELRRVYQKLSSWTELPALAAAEKSLLYIFRGVKLIATIQPLNPQTT